MNERKNADLERYMKRKGIIPEYILKKYSDSDISSLQELRYWYRRQSDEVSLANLREICNVIFIFKDTAYVSEDIKVEKLLALRLVKKLFEKYSNKPGEIAEFLETGTIIFDVNNFYNETFVFMDWKHRIIAIVDKFNVKNKLFNTKILEADFLDEESKISDELYKRLTGKERFEEYEDEKVFSKYDDEYFEMEEEYEGMYAY